MARFLITMKNTGLFLIFVTILGVMILNSTPCSAVEFTVDTLVDTPDLDPGDGFCQDNQGNCSLRAAIEETNIWGGADSIVLPAGTYAINAFLVVTDHLLISGESPQTTILDAGGKVDTTTAIIHACVTPNVEIERLALANNTGHNGGGAFVCSGTELRLTEVEVRHNT
ncbi:MAG: CSLREA domain-containing protein, partial [Thermoanaerobaculales bacterium]|nr:CSLREA domain-containing protein [Thermoanaerobaculales bacterium]